MDLPYLQSGGFPYIASKLHEQAKGKRLPSSNLRVPEDPPGED